MSVQITVKKPNMLIIAGAPLQAIILSLPECALPLKRNIEVEAWARARLRRGPKRLEFVDVKIDQGGLRLKVWPRGPLSHLLDLGVQPHSLAPLHAVAHPRASYPMHPGFRGRDFLPAALQDSISEIQRIVDRNTIAQLERTSKEAHG